MFRRTFAATLAFALIGGAATMASAQMAGPSTDPAAAPAGVYAMDKFHTSLVVRLKHLGLSNFAMRFDGVDGSYAYDPAHPTATKVMATIDPTTADVGNQQFNDTMTLNQHFVKQRDVAGAAKTPMITFNSKSITVSQGNRGVMVGDLTMNGVTKPVTLDVTFNGTMAGMGGGAQRMGFSAMGTIKRSDFGILSFVPAAAASRATMSR